MLPRTKWILVAVFAIAMAWAEAAVVLDLRTMVNRLDPYQHEPLPEMGTIGLAELVREIATLVMLATLGLLAGTTWRMRFGYGIVAFGLWDIFYYLFLRILTDWPKSLYDWDILFLLPLPWWGPVLAPVLVSVVMIIGGVALVETERMYPHKGPSVWSVAAAILGVLLILYTFMCDALRVANQGENALRQMLPVSFNWQLFGLGLLLAATPVAAIVAQTVRGTKKPGEDQPVIK